MAKNLKPKEDSLVALTRKYANNYDECIRFFFDMKWPTGFYCEKCGCIVSELAETVQYGQYT